MNTKNIIIIILVLAILAVGGFYMYPKMHSSEVVPMSGEEMDMDDHDDFGDDGDEGGSVRQDASLIVQESIVGKWKSDDDAKFIREFKSGGLVDDLYEGKVVSSGNFKAFTTINPVKTDFPLETGVVYLEQTESGTQADKLYFKVVKLTPESLELIYMARGSTLKFTKSQ